MYSYRTIHGFSTQSMNSSYIFTQMNPFWHFLISHFSPNSSCNSDFAMEEDDPYF